MATEDTAPQRLDPEYSDDLLHVLADALDLLRAASQDGDLQPWSHYGEEDPADPKTSRATYLTLLHEADARVQDMLTVSLALPKLRVPTNSATPSP